MTTPSRTPTTFFVAASHRSAVDFVAVAQMIEEHGFDGISIADHLFVPANPMHGYPYSADGRPPFAETTPWPDALVLAAAAATVTSRLRFMTGVYILPLRHPLIVARAAGTVDALAPGRLDLGVGVGWIRDEFDALGVDFSFARGRRTDESIDFLRALWRGGLVHHEGPHYGMPPLHFEPHPASPISILIGGASRPALERAARRGDGYIAAPSTVDELIEQAAQIRQLRESFGVSERPFSFRARPRDVTNLDEYRRLIDAGIDSFVVPALGGTREEVRRRLEDAVAHVLVPLRDSGHIEKG